MRIYMLMLTGNEEVTAERVHDHWPRKISLLPWYLLEILNLFYALRNAFMFFLILLHRSLICWKHIKTSMSEIEHVSSLNFDISILELDVYMYILVIASTDIVE